MGSTHLIWTRRVLGPTATGVQLGNTQVYHISQPSKSKEVFRNKIDLLFHICIQSTKGASWSVLAFANIRKLARLQRTLWEGMQSRDWKEMDKIVKSHEVHFPKVDIIHLLRHCKKTLDLSSIPTLDVQGCLLFQKSIFYKTWYKSFEFYINIIFAFLIYELLPILRFE